VTYTAVFSVGVWYIRKLMAKGPVPALLEPPAGVANRPLSAAQRATVHAARGEATP
jgi:cytochrome d ubiquinol oxidase subunit I